MMKPRDIQTNYYIKLYTGDLNDFQKSWFDRPEIISGLFKHHVFGYVVQVDDTVYKNILNGSKVLTLLVRPDGDSHQIYFTFKVESIYCEELKEMFHIER